MKDYISLVNLKHAFLTKHRDVLKIETDFNSPRLTIHSANKDTASIYIPGSVPKKINYVHAGDILEFGTSKQTYLKLSDNSDFIRHLDQLNRRGLYQVGEDGLTLCRVDEIKDRSIVPVNGQLADISGMILSKVFLIEDPLILRCLNYSQLLETHNIVNKPYTEGSSITTLPSGQVIGKDLKLGLSIYNPSGEDFCVEIAPKIMMRNINKVKFELLVHKDLLVNIPNYILEVVK